MLLLAACALLACACAFNLDVKHAIVFEDPEGHTGSHFGYTVSLLKETGSDGGSWLLVGAPMGNTTYRNGTTIKQHGLIYQCKLGKNNEGCKSLRLDSQEGKRKQQTRGLSLEDNMEHALLGSTLEVQGAENGKIVVCAPGWKNKYYADAYNMNGVCYLLSGSKDFGLDAKKLIPLLKSEHQEINLEAKYGIKVDPYEAFYYLYGGAGMSANFVENSTEMLVGAPGVFNWTGTVIRFRDSVDNRSGIPRRYLDTTIPNPYKTENFKTDSYFGYSVGSGRFLHSNKTLYVGGAPRGGNLKGKVYIFDFHDSEEASFIIKKEITGYQMGEYFGSCVCVVDLNSDGLDDLVIGAPQHSLRTSSVLQNNGDEGRIYVFINKDSMTFHEIGDDSKIMGSQQQGSRFGTSVANLGDINNDGYSDIAVGAPYENSGHGAVYIYHGRFDGINPKFVQCIIANDIDPSILGFGFSISRGSDIDENNYHDVAVGAYQSEHAVILRAHPVIMFHPSLVANVSKIKFNATGFLATACLSYAGKYAPQSIAAKITLEADPVYRRANFVLNKANKNLTLQYEVKLDHTVKSCSEYMVEIHAEDNDFSKPIELVMRYKLLNSRKTQRNKREKSDDSGDFCKTCPVVDPSAPLRTQYIVPYVTGCADDNICRTDIKTEVELLDVKSPFDIGSEDTLTMKVFIRNVGEPAFLSQTNITFPKMTPIMRVPTNCKESSSTISNYDNDLNCEMGNPLKFNETREMILQFSTKKIPTGSDRLLFKISSGSTGEDLKDDDNIQEIVVPLRTISDISIVGKSSQERFYLVKKNDSYADQVISVVHVYEVYNLGPSPVRRVNLTFAIPVMTKDSSGLVHFVKVYKPQTIFDSQSFTCTPSGFEYYSDDNIFNGSNATSASDSYFEANKRKITENTGEIRPTTNPSTSFLRDDRTFHVSCSVPETLCMSVECIIGPFETPQTRALVFFPLKITPKVWKPVIEHKDVIVVSTSGSVEILDFPLPMEPETPKPDFADVYTSIEKLPESKIAAWIVALAIIGGILLLLLFTVCLVKMGFFKRHKKEELQSLKKTHEMENDCLSEDAT